jgi:hypothetical protein
VTVVEGRMPNPKRADEVIDAKGTGNAAWTS